MAKNANSEEKFISTAFKFGLRNFNFANLRRYFD